MIPENRSAYHTGHHRNLRTTTIWREKGWGDRREGQILTPRLGLLVSNHHGLVRGDCRFGTLATGVHEGRDDV